MYIDSDFYKTKYAIDIQNRSYIRFIKGLVPRFIAYIRYSYNVSLARKNGAIIGKCVTLPHDLAKRANSNLVIGDHSSIHTSKIDLRSPVKIGNHVLIGSDVEIITTSHNIDSPDWEHKYYGIEIEDFTWLATRVFVLPSCRKIGYGTVCAAGTVLAKNIDSMKVVSGNPGQILRERIYVHAALCVESMLGNDFIAYFKAYTFKFKKCL